MTRTPILTDEEIDDLVRKHAGYGRDALRAAMSAISDAKKEN